LLFDVGIRKLGPNLHKRKFKKKQQTKQQHQKHGRKPSRQQKVPEGDDRRRPTPRHAPVSGKHYIGKVQKNPKGFAFLLVQGAEKKIPDAYVPKEEASFLLNDDLVEFELYREGHHTSAKIVRVVRRGQKRIVGRVHVKGKEAILQTSEGEVHVLTGLKGFRGGAAEIDYHWVIADIIKYPSRDEPAQVQVWKVLGRELLPEHDYLIAIARAGLEDHFSMDVLVDARKAVEKEIAPGKFRKDLRELPFITIDGEDAKDFDDAVYVKGQKGQVAFVLYVAIADVSAYVRPGSPLDDAARSRSTSVYFPGMCIPMLPELLSNDVCSLRPNVDRLALTAEIHFDFNGVVVDTDFYESVICTKRRTTYTEVQAYLDKEPKALEDMAFLKTSLHDLRALYQRLSQNRVERGALDFELPECKISIDDKGRPVSAGPARRMEAHKIIEEFMIAANEAVAACLKNTNTPSLYRVHESPKLEAQEEINSLLRTLGFSMRIKDLTPRSVAQILTKTANDAKAKTLHQAILRLQKQAKYDPSPDGHFGLALADYTHFTSPIRRYPDLVVHRALKQVIKRTMGADTESGDVSHFESKDSLAALGQDTSEKERRAIDAERFAVKRKQCWFMNERIGDVYEGRISGLMQKGIFVEIPEYAIEGFLPLDALEGDYVFDEQSLCIRKRPGHTQLHIGDSLKIEVAEISIEKNEITFSSP
jgi:ribonuclease R